MQNDSYVCCARVSFKMQVKTCIRIVSFGEQHKFDVLKIKSCTLGVLKIIILPYILAYKSSFLFTFV